MTRKSNIVDERLHLIEGDGTKLPNQEQYIKIEWNVIVAAVVGRRFGGCVIIIKHSIAPEINIYAYVLRIYEIWILCKSLVMQSQKYAIRQPTANVVRLFPIPVVWNRAIEWICVSLQYRDEHTPDPASTDAKKEKLLGSNERHMRWVAAPIIFYTYLGRARERERTTGARYFTVNSVIFDFVVDAERNSQHSTSTMTTLWHLFILLAASILHDLLISDTPLLF